MQAKIFAIIFTALLAGAAEASPSPFGMYRNRCCCFSNTKNRDTKIGCIVSGWAGPKCPAGEYECVV